MKCINCGKTIPDKSKFCPECGGKIPAARRGRKPKEKGDPVVIKYIDKLAYSAGELAAAIGISRGRVYELMEQRKIAYAQIDGRKVISRKAAEEFLSKYEVPAELHKLVEVS